MHGASGGRGAVLRALNRTVCPESRMEPCSACCVALGELFMLSGPDTLVSVLLGKR